jgi:hypothetical protein
MPEVPAGYVVGTAAVLGGEKGEYGNEGEGRDSSRDKYLYEVRGLWKSYGWRWCGIAADVGLLALGLVSWGLG